MSKASSTASNWEVLPPWKERTSQSPQTWQSPINDLTSRLSQTHIQSSRIIPPQQSSQQESRIPSGGSAGSHGSGTRKSGWARLASKSILAEPSSSEGERTEEEEVVIKQKQVKETTRPSAGGGTSLSEKKEGGKMKGKNPAVPNKNKEPTRQHTASSTTTDSTIVTPLPSSSNQQTKLSKRNRSSKPRNQSTTGQAGTSTVESSVVMVPTEASSDLGVRSTFSTSTSASQAPPESMVSSVPSGNALRKVPDSELTPVQLKRREQHRRYRQRERERKARQSGTKDFDPGSVGNSRSAASSSFVPPPSYERDAPIDVQPTGPVIKMDKYNFRSYGHPQGGRGASETAGGSGDSDSGLVVPQSKILGRPMTTGFLGLESNKRMDIGSNGSSFVDVGNSQAGKSFSNTAGSVRTESIAPHHSVSRSGSPSTAIPPSKTLPIIAGLQSLRLESSTPAGAFSGTPFGEYAESVSSLEEAHSSVDAFMRNDESFLKDERNKLKFWQGLCLEFGLAVLPSFESQFLETDPNFLPPSPPASDRISIGDTPRQRGRVLHVSSNVNDSGSKHTNHTLAARRRSVSTVGSDSTVQRGDCSRSSTPRPAVPVVPTTLSGCQKLLKTYAHVNLVDFWTTRENLRISGKQSDGLKRMSSAEQAVRFKPMRDLLFPSTRKMILYTRETRKFMDKKVSKSQWLDPLMRTINY